MLHVIKNTTEPNRISSQPRDIAAYRICHRIYWLTCRLFSEHEWFSTQHAYPPTYINLCDCHQHLQLHQLGIDRSFQYICYRAYADHWLVSRKNMPSLHTIIQLQVNVLWGFISSFEASGINQYHGQHTRLERSLGLS